MYNRQTFSNNLRLITVPQLGTRAVTVLVLIGTGSKYETKELNGISHFLEHMMFKGTKRRPTSLSIAGALDKVGGVYNAFTGKELTGYFAKVQAKHFDLALDWVSDILLHSQIRTTDLNRERGVILEELNMYRDTPIQYISDCWEDLLYGDQPAGWDIIGTKENIKTFQRNQFLNYLKNHYLASNTVIGVAGDIKAINDLEKRVEISFQGIEEGLAKPKSGVKESQEKPESLIQFKKTDQSHLYLGVRGYSQQDEERYPQKVLATLLGGNMSSRLFDLIREKNGLAYYIQTRAETYTDTGFLVTRAGVRNDKAAMAIELILQEYGKIRKEGAKEKEIVQAKEYIKGTFLLSLESSEAIINYYAQRELLEMGFLTPREFCSRIDQITKEEVDQVAHDIFQNKNLNLALIGPYRQKDFKEILIL
jgi:predicted Zn-dependent peptidase